MAQHKQGGRHIFLLFLLLNVLALASCKSTSRAAFLPRTDITRGDDAIKSPLKRPLSPTSGNQQSVVTRGGAVPLPAKNAVIGALAFTALDHGFRKAFLANGISFPSQLGGCCILFVLLLLANIVKPGLGDAVFTALTPGAQLLAKWLPVFFVPGLAMLPNAPSMGSAVEILKVLAVVVVGFYFSAATTAYAVLFLRKMEGSLTTAVTDSGTKGPAALPFSADLVDTLLKGFVLSGALAIGALRLGNGYASPLRTIFMTFTAFFGYVWGARLPPAFTKLVHPLVTSTAVTLVATQLIAMTTGSVFTDVLATYKENTMNPMETGAGDILLYLLGPCVVSFAISIYSRKTVIAENFLTVCTSMIVGSVGGLFGTAFFVRLINLGGANGDVLRKSMLPRNITTPLAIAISKIIGANIPQACAVVVLTGIYGATSGASFMTALGITDPVSRGLAIGASGQGLGVASIMHEKEAFPFAAVSMVLTAVAATTFVSIPAFANALVKVTTGN